MKANIVINRLINKRAILLEQIANQQTFPEGYQHRKALVEGDIKAAYRDNEGTDIELRQYANALKTL